MSDYIEVSPADISDERNRRLINNILDSYECPLNPDVQKFIRTQALKFSKQRISITYLVLHTTFEHNTLVGYYTLANKFVKIAERGLSNTFKKRILKFSQYDINLQSYMISMPLIAQLGKNYSKNALELYVSGTQILNSAIKKIKSVQNIIGGKTLYIECEDNTKLKEFYSENGFIEFGKKKKNNADENTEQPYFNTDVKIY